MSDKSKLYVFEKKEVALIFVFMLLVALTAFMLGVRIGKNYSFDAAGLTSEDRQRVEFLSEQEEMIRQILDSEEFEPMDTDELNRQMQEALRKRIQEQLQEPRSELTPTSPEVSVSPPPSSSAPLEQDTVKKKEQNLADTTTPEYQEKPRSAFQGKFTIQLGSYRRLSEAEDFARGFVARGYEPIINEVEIPNRGTWFRVSLGVFETSTEANRYIRANPDLFHGQDYVLARFD